MLFLQDGYTALHMAVSYQLPYIVELLLENGANVNIQSTTGQTPIMEAVLQGENVMVEMLTRHRADVTIPDHVGFSLQFCASFPSQSHVYYYTLQLRSILSFCRQLCT